MRKFVFYRVTNLSFTQFETVEKTGVHHFKEVTPGLEALSEYLFDSQSDRVAKKIHPSP